MKLELTEEEAQLLLEVFTVLNMQGTNSARQVIALEDKIMKAAKKDIDKQTKIKNNDNKRE